MQRSYILDKRCHRITKRILAIRISFFVFFCKLNFRILHSTRSFQTTYTKTILRFHLFTAVYNQVPHKTLIINTTKPKKIKFSPLTIKQIDLNLPQNAKIYQMHRSTYYTKSTRNSSKHLEST